MYQNIYFLFQKTHTNNEQKKIKMKREKQKKPKKKRRERMLLLRTVENLTKYNEIVCEFVLCLVGACNHCAVTSNF